MTCNDVEHRVITQVQACFLSAKEKHMYAAIKCWERAEDAKKDALARGASLDEADKIYSETYDREAKEAYKLIGAMSGGAVGGVAKNVALGAIGAVALMNPVALAGAAVIGAISGLGWLLSRSEK